MRYITLLTIGLLLSCNSQKENKTGSTSVTVKNSLGTLRNNALISVSRDELPKDFNPAAFVVKEGNKVIPSQWTEASEELMFVVEKLDPKEIREYSVSHATEKHTYPKRTQAELSVKTGGTFENKKYSGGVFKNVAYLRVPDEHTDHSNYFRYEGPGWESDKVAYRFYLDWRNATDVFGKTGNEMVLQKVGQDNFSSYHEMQSWGMDILKVGESLGLGSLGLFHEGKAVRVDKTDSIVSRVYENDVLFSGIATDYYGWKVAGHSLNVHSHLSIHSGTRLTHHHVKVTGDPANLCTGIGKDEKSQLYTDQGSKSQYGYIATYGVQSLNNDKLGLAVFFPADNFIGFTADSNSNIVKLAPTSGELNYYFSAAWEKEAEGITTEEAFLNYVQATAKALANPVNVAVNTP